MKICSNCGSKANDSSAFCSFCGKPLTYTFDKKNKSLNKKVLLIVIMIVITLFVLLAGIITAVCIRKHYNSYEKAINDAFAFNFGRMDVTYLEKLAPEEFWEYVEYEMGFDVHSKYDLKEFEYDEYKEMMDENKEYFGDDFSYSIEINDVDELSKEEFKEIVYSLNYEYGISKSLISEALYVEIEINHLYVSENIDQGEGELYVVKIDNRWYVLDDDYNFWVDECYDLVA